MRALARGLKWVAAGLTLVVAAGFGAFFFFLFEKEQQFWDAFDASRPAVRVRLADLPEALREAVLFAEGNGQRACACGSVITDFYRNHQAGKFEVASCPMERQLVRLATTNLWKGAFSRIVGSEVALCNLVAIRHFERLEILLRKESGRAQSGRIRGAGGVAEKPLQFFPEEETGEFSSASRIRAQAPPHSPRIFDGQVGEIADGTP